MKITDIRATTVTVPLEAPLRHSNGAHWGRFVRTLVEVETDEAITGLGEMGGASFVPSCLAHTAASPLLNVVLRPTPCSSLSFARL
jgi:L-alanine-DL-glutamate epimerase-like enolase superfamily enzyme